MIWLAFVLLTVAFLVFHTVQSRDWQKERQLLLTRIQAPELAPVLVPQREDVDEPTWVAPDDDPAFFDAVRERS